MRITALIISMLFAFLFTTGAAMAADQPDMTKVGQAFDRGDITEAVRMVKILANEGNPEAQFSLAVCYDNGNGVAYSQQKGLYW